MIVTIEKWEIAASIMALLVILWAFLDMIRKRTKKRRAKPCKQKKLHFKGKPQH